MLQQIYLSAFMYILLKHICFEQARADFWHQIDMQKIQGGQMHDCVWNILWDNEEQGRLSNSSNTAGPDSIARNNKRQRIKYLQLQPSWKVR